MTMKIYFLTIIYIGFAFFSKIQAQNLPSGAAFDFKISIENGATSVKNQERSGTCWSFSTVSFLESEMIRTGGKAIDLSELFIVNGIYRDKAENYILRQGDAGFSEGALSHDVINGYKKYGIVPQDVYSGLPPGSETIDHSELVAAIGGMLDGILKNKGGVYWRDATEALLDVYMGPVPATFNYEGKEYTAKSFAEKVVRLRPGDYIEISSFTHVPLYEAFVLEVPDNFSSGRYFNVKLDEMVETVRQALANGYTVVWDCDVSEKGFNPREGYAIIPDPAGGSRNGLPVEVNVTPAMRQAAYERFATTDDHLMHIIGMAKDKNGNEYFIVKNSWGEVGPFEGYLYASIPYFKMKTLGIMLHKDAVPKSIAGKLFK